MTEEEIDKEIDEFLKDLSVREKKLKQPTRDLFSEGIDIIDLLKENRKKELLF